MRRILAILCVALVLATGGLSTGYLVRGAVAQEAVSAAAFAEWEKVASRAESALEIDRASTKALEELRAEIVIWRTRFVAGQDVNGARIETLRAQLAAIGPAPGEGESEPAEITARRDTLSELLASLTGPELSAREAHSRADGIIRQIDAVVRDRRKSSLMELGPSPLNPVLWLPAVKEFQKSFELAGTEFRASWLSATKQKLLRRNAPATLFFLAVALVLLFRSRYWVERLTLRIQANMDQAYQRLLETVVSAGQVILPVIGIFAFSEALFSTGLLGLRGQINANSLPTIAFAFFAARWLSIRLFPLSDRRAGIIDATPETSSIVRRAAAVAGLLFGLHVLIENIATFDGFSAATVAVLQFLPLLLSGVLLFRVGKILVVGHSEPGTSDSSDAKFRNRAVNFVGRAMMAAGVAGPVLAALGYYVAASSLIYPAVVSAGLVALLALASGVIRDLYSLLTRNDEAGARAALMPVLLSFALVILAIPLFALIWGARVSDLTEIWTRMGEGFLIGDARISPTQFFTFIIIFIIGYMATRLVQSTLKTSVLPKTRIDTGGQVAIVSGLGYVGIFLAALVAISTAGINLSSLAIVAGALSVGIGFGLQTIVSNFVSGIILLIERPIAEGDWIEVGPNMGIVKDISVRATRIETFDRTDVIVPNADLVSGTVTNFTRGNVLGRAIVPVGVAYGTDTRKVEAVLKEIAEAHPMVSLNPGPAVHFVGFGADSLDFEIRAILRDINFGLSVRTEMRHQIVERFAEEGIEIPFAQRDVWLRNPEALRPEPAKPPTKPRAKPKGKTT